MAPALSGSQTRARLSFRSEASPNPNGTRSLHDEFAALREHTIRSARADDHPRAAALFAAYLPDRADEPERWRDEDAKGSVTRWVGETDTGDLAAYAALWCVKDDRYRLDLIVATDHRRRG